MRRDLSIYPLFSFFLYIYIYIVSLFHSLSLSLFVCSSFFPFALSLFISLFYRESTESLYDSTACSPPLFFLVLVVVARSVLLRARFIRRYTTSDEFQDERDTKQGGKQAVQCLALLSLFSLSRF